MPLVSTTATGETQIEGAEIRTATNTGAVSEPTIIPAGKPAKTPTTAATPKGVKENTLACAGNACTETGSIGDGAGPG